MRRLQLLLVVLVAGSAVAACIATTTLAPGADQVKITRAAADVAGCSAVGNVKVPRNSQGLVDIATADTEFRNQVIGFGGTVGFVTAGALGVMTEGVAYRCP